MIFLNHFWPSRSFRPYHHSLVKWNQLWVTKRVVILIITFYTSGVVTLLPAFVECCFFLKVWYPNCCCEPFTKTYSAPPTLWLVRSPLPMKCFCFFKSSCLIVEIIKSIRCVCFRFCFSIIRHQSFLVDKGSNRAKRNQCVYIQHTILLYIITRNAACAGTNQFSIWGACSRKWIEGRPLYIFTLILFFR